MVDDVETGDPEIIAITAVHNALRSLSPDAQSRVLAYVAAKLRRELPSDARLPLRDMCASSAETKPQVAWPAPMRPRMVAAG